ncbi:hypothetical protein JNM05_03990 [bacterium]|nr:hypothetical protein [bacterium]
MVIDNDIIQALDEIILGRIVKRSKHELTWDDKNIREEFIQRLLHNHFEFKKVKNVDVPIGFRCPAFLLREQWAYFGWVKWMKYDEGIYWKYFASEVRRPSGSPVIIITSDDIKEIYVNDLSHEEHDPDLPPLYE